MASHFSIWMTIADSPMILFVVLLGFSHLIYYRYFQQVKPTIASGAFLMALAIFSISCLPRFGFMPIIILISALLLLVLWFYLVVILLNHYLLDYFNFRTSANRIDLGTWIAGTAMVVLLLEQAEPTLHGFIVLLGLIATILWFIYAGLMLKWFYLIIRKQFHVPATGTILLLTIGTQALILLFNELFRDDIPAGFYQTFIVLGGIYYLCGLLLILNYFFKARLKHIVAIWPNANCLFYSAIAITGLAILETRVFSETWVINLWWLTVISFLINTALEIGRSISRIRIKGWIKGIASYTASQWLRVFSFGMVFAFAWAYHNQHYPLNEIAKVVANNGQYVVTVLVIVELCLMIRHFFYRERR